MLRHLETAKKLLNKILRPCQDVQSILDLTEKWLKRHRMRTLRKIHLDKWNGTEVVQQNNLVVIPNFIAIFSFVVSLKLGQPKVLKPSAEHLSWKHRNSTRRRRQKLLYLNSELSVGLFAWRQSEFDCAILEQIHFIHSGCFPKHRGQWWNVWH